MKKMFFVFLIAIININLWAENLDYVIHLGTNLSILDNRLTIDQLCYLSGEELRILRNTIYAKHGLKFNSRDLLEHFNKFSWYSGIKSNVENELLEIDRENIAFIQKIEANYPNDNDSRIINIIGTWAFYGAMPAGLDSPNGRYADHMGICPNGTYIYIERKDRHTFSYGIWSLKNNVFETKLIKADNKNTNKGRPKEGVVNDYSINPNEFGIGKLLTCDFFNRGYWGKYTNDINCNSQDKI
ncbi:MAG: YARHG domain-containing protein [Treponema sp.]|jgi:hypothetical protein|nr:YARHG domain-containing protein [Treponema sp.]